MSGHLLDAADRAEPQPKATHHPRGIVPSRPSMLAQSRPVKSLVLPTEPAAVRLKGRDQKVGAPACQPRNLKVSRTRTPAPSTIVHTPKPCNPGCHRSADTHHQAKQEEGVPRLGQLSSARNKSRVVNSLLRLHSANQLQPIWPSRGPAPSLIAHEGCKREVHRYFPIWEVSQPKTANARGGWTGRSWRYVREPPWFTGDRFDSSDD